jgi:methylthioribose-1-phosphate isomerase
MKVAGQSYRTIWAREGGEAVGIIDQTALPFRFEVVWLSTLDGVVGAISSMQVRGAPLIGAAAAWGLALAMNERSSTAALERAAHQLIATRPTAINLKKVVDSVAGELARAAEADRPRLARRLAAERCDDEVARSRAIGEHGAGVLRALFEKKGRETLQILTHCNAGWLATVDYGTALAPIYLAHDAGLPIHVWVDETRPRNQGASLTAWELAQHGVPHTLIVDNAGGLLMRDRRVDVCLVGTDRTTREGEVCNKVGTYLKALAAFDNGVPFYVAAPESSIDWDLDSSAVIPIEERSATEITHLRGVDAEGRLHTVRVCPEGTPVFNPGFDVTPARLVTGLITERGVCAATSAGLFELFPEHAR